MARKEKFYVRAKKARKIGLTNTRNLALTKKGRNGIVL